MGMRLALSPAERQPPGALRRKLSSQLQRWRAKRPLRLPTPAHVRRALAEGLPVRLQLRDGSGSSFEYSLSPWCINRCSSASAVSMVTITAVRVGVQRILQVMCIESLCQNKKIYGGDKANYGGIEAGVSQGPGPGTNQVAKRSPQGENLSVKKRAGVQAAARSQTQRAFLPGALVIVTLGNPREKFWGMILELAAEGLSLSGAELASFEDLAAMVKEGEPFTPAVVFFPMHRIERVELDLPDGNLPSLSERFLAKTGLEPCAALTPSIPARTVQAPAIQRPGASTGAKPHAAKERA